MKNYNRKFGSPIFTFRNSSDIVANGFFGVDFEIADKRASKYLPFNLTQVVNNSSNNIVFYPNHDYKKGKLIPAGTIFVFDSATLPAIRSFLIENKSSTASINADEIEVTVQREDITTDKAFQILTDKIFNKKDRWTV